METDNFFVEVPTLWSFIRRFHPGVYINELVEMFFTGLFKILLANYKSFKTGALVLGVLRFS